MFHKLHRRLSMFVFQNAPDLPFQRNLGTLPSISWPTEPILPDRGCIVPIDMGQERNRMTYPPSLPVHTKTSSFRLPKEWEVCHRHETFSYGRSSNSHPHASMPPNCLDVRRP